MRKLKRSNSDLLNEQQLANWSTTIKNAKSYQKIVDQNFVPNVMRIQRENGELKEILKNTGVKLPEESPQPVESKAEAIIAKLENSEPAQVFGDHEA